MKKSIAILSIVLAATTFAADFTITLTARQTRVLQAVSTRLTEQRGTNVTPRMYLEEVVAIDLRQRAEEQRAGEVDPLVKAWDAATDEQKAAARTALGVQ